MSPSVVRFVAAALVIVLTTGCGPSLEERLPDESIARTRSLSGPRVVFVMAKPRTKPGPDVSPAQLLEFLETILPDVRSDVLDAEWHQIVSDARFNSLRAERPKRQYRLMFASWKPGGARLADMTTGYQQWCSSPGRRTRCVPTPKGQTSLTDAEVYKVAFDFAMGVQWKGFTDELKGTFQLSTLRFVILTGLVIFMACIAIPELTTKIPVAIATAVLMSYLGAQAVCDLVFGWIRMVREVDTATTFEQLRAAGERYGQLIGAETARILIMLAMTAVSEGGVIARLMTLPKIEEASVALAESTRGVGLESITTQVRGAKVLQGGVSITVEGIAQGAAGAVIGARWGGPNLEMTVPSRGPPNPHGSKGGPTHQAKVQERIDQLKNEGHKHIGGGDRKEEVIDVPPGGKRSTRRTDITTIDPDGHIHREQIGKTNKDGTPVWRERDALDDIERATGDRPTFIPYDKP